MYGGSFRTYENKILGFFHRQKKIFGFVSASKNVSVIVFPRKKIFCCFPQVEILSVFVSTGKHIFSLCFRK